MKFIPAIIMCMLIGISDYIIIDSGFMTFQEVVIGNFAIVIGLLVGIITTLQSDEEINKKPQRPPGV